MNDAVRQIQYQITEEEGRLHEYAHLGNWKAVGILLKSGIAVNAANTVNGMTALHWASERNHVQIVALLLSHGADPTLRNKNNKTALDLSQNKVIQGLIKSEPTETTKTAATAATADVAEQPDPNVDFEMEGVIASTDDEKVNSFVPNYLKYPDLSKVWELPEGVRIAATPTAESVSSVSSVWTDVVPSKDITSENRAEKELELLVYQDQNTDSQLLGAVFVSPNARIGDMINQIKEELDDVPPHFRLFRSNAAREVPINQRQFDAPVGKHFQPGADAVVIKARQAE
ncbi:hypothetical protein BJ085DRAFT_41061 [Dimargaris cristalligena]|uniref:Uncharacterized protein n=1 Tax=Dimargaris cristalligena TaxID=215637 RepID=A0A4P9ZZS5_9FUNG|nr:hypothetical protein BJ085DRAFT_41061 [Dimargaris cristalligena]|eukprot:RKP39243.1 hypothetical protein BJ085DRAFT_41061 [Dimargaris cristalligena]